MPQTTTTPSTIIQAIIIQTGSGTFSEITSGTNTSASTQTTSTTDNCNDVICKNNGICISGACVCELGYFGKDCVNVNGSFTTTTTAKETLTFPNSDTTNIITLPASTQTGNSITL
jgi:hypothetical protein